MIISFDASGSPKPQASLVDLRAPRAAWVDGRRISVAEAERLFATEGQCWIPEYSVYALPPLAGAILVRDAQEREKVLSLANTRSVGSALRHVRRHFDESRRLTGIQLASTGVLPLEEELVAPLITEVLGEIDALEQWWEEN